MIDKVLKFLFQNNKNYFIALGILFLIFVVLFVQSVSAATWFSTYTYRAQDQNNPYVGTVIKNWTYPINSSEGIANLNGACTPRIIATGVVNTTGANATNSTNYLYYESCTDFVLVNGTSDEQLPLDSNITAFNPTQVYSYLNLNLPLNSTIHGTNTSTTVDTARNGYHGKITGTPTNTTGVFGVGLSGFSSTVYIDIPASSFNNIAAGAIQFWVRFNGDGVQECFLGKGQSGNVPLEFCRQADNTFYMELPSPIFCVWGSATLTGSGWTQFTIIWDGSNHMLYLNKTPLASCANTDTVGDDLVNTLRLGDAKDGAAVSTTQFDNFRVYASNITVAEIESSYHAGTIRVSTLQAQETQATPSPTLGNITITPGNSSVYGFGKYYNYSGDALCGTGGSPNVCDIWLEHDGNRTGVFNASTSSGYTGGRIYSTTGDNTSHVKFWGQIFDYNGSTHPFKVFVNNTTTNWATTTIGSYDVQDATINGTTLHLWIDNVSTNKSVTLGTATEIRANNTNDGDGDVTYRLQLNNTIIGYGSSVFQNLPLGFGTHQLNYSTSGNGENYSSTYGQNATLFVTVEARNTLDVYLNTTFNGNHSVFVNSDINATGLTNMTNQLSNSSSSATELYRNGSFIAASNIINGNFEQFLNNNTALRWTLVLTGSDTMTFVPQPSGFMNGPGNSVFFTHSPGDTITFTSHNISGLNVSNLKIRFNTFQTASPSSGWNINLFKDNVIDQTVVASTDTINIAQPYFNLTNYNTSTKYNIQLNITEGGVDTKNLYLDSFNIADSNNNSYTGIMATDFIRNVQTSGSYQYLVNGTANSTGITYYFFVNPFIGNSTLLFNGTVRNLTVEDREYVNITGFTNITGQRISLDGNHSRLGINFSSGFTRTLFTFLGINEMDLFSSDVKSLFLSNGSKFRIIPKATAGDDVGTVEFGTCTSGDSSMFDGSFQTSCTTSGPFSGNKSVYENYTSVGISKINLTSAVANGVVTCGFTQMVYNKTSASWQALNSLSTSFTGSKNMSVMIDNATDYISDGNFMFRMEILDEGPNCLLGYHETQLDSNITTKSLHRNDTINYAFVSLSGYNNSGYPNNVTIDVGDDSVIDFAITGEIRENNISFGNSINKTQTLNFTFNTSGSKSGYFYLSKDLNYTVALMNITGFQEPNDFVHPNGSITSTGAHWRYTAPDSPSQLNCTGLIGWVTGDTAGDGFVTLLANGTMQANSMCKTYHDWFVNGTQAKEISFQIKGRNVTYAQNLSFTVTFETDCNTYGAEVLASKPVIRLNSLNDSGWSEYVFDYPDIYGNGVAQNQMMCFRIFTDDNIRWDHAGTNVGFSIDNITFRNPNQNYSVNPNIVMGNSNVTQWNFTGNYSNDEQVSNFSRYLNEYLASCTPEYRRVCAVPVVVSQSKWGILQIDAINLTTNILDKIGLNRTAITNFTRNCGVPCQVPINISYNGTGVLRMSALNISWNGTGRYNITAYTEGNSSHSSALMTNYLKIVYSKFNASLPYRFSDTWFPLAPTNNTRNVTPFGQTLKIPIYNITGKAYENNFSIGIKLYETVNSCLNITWSNTSSRFNGTTYNTSSSTVLNYQTIIPNMNLDSNASIFLTLDYYNCNATTYPFFRPNISLKSCVAAVVVDSLRCW